MDNPGVLIAVDMIALYLILGPVVIFGFYVVFDNLGKSKKLSKKKKDVALSSLKELKAKNSIN